MLRYPQGVLQGVFLTAREGLAITDAELLTTADGGRTWANVPVRGSSIGFRALGALDQQHVWLGGLDLSSDCRRALPWLAGPIGEWFGSGCRSVGAVRLDPHVQLP
jgi:hypothetical protein